MDEEFFDIVNERDEIIGREPRSVVHARGLRHRAVHVLVFNSAGQLFLQKRSMAKDNDPGLWDSSCSGHVDAGEDYDTGGERELLEEIGLQPTLPLKSLFKTDACELTGWEFARVYRTIAEGPFTLHPDEIDEGRWLTPEQLTKAIAGAPERYSPTLRLIWERLQ